MFPLDRSRLTREWFDSGRAVYAVTGPDADAFEGTLELGYPWSLGADIQEPATFSVAVAGARGPLLWPMPTAR
ncbi:MULTISPECIES: MspA family porin [unclassified Mycobacteroides]|uniref:MspA family porin n=1 Tax=unclassified Mycobacteroides TaxID=2618759 RepID=UPI001322AE65|nr:hypothetical protein [Mycobacteroides sp. CBMA 326]MUM17370.1 hypothetical protein [Mycobacteroides sp. CBMA 326]